ncbi:iron uptake porin [Nostoc sp. FACHB-152]|uniref:iron uptake porin n=1 Tax=unclassified Nostoc TaxID=2593658 RepID=UPI00168939F7|nr:MULTISPECIES: iron uptake porin [unclassified Nostoc]MBD2447259.1 iron uptake porin [Nostoc sp. FACHB-152]MBD2468140.1 iron uptake porin [Nostoc sp. FACHB-145]
MNKSFWNVLKVSPVVLAATLLAANSALAGEANEQITNVAQLSQESDSMAQVTSVSQFSDVQPTDWAFQALQSLVERYGCIAGYPNGTYRGNRALTRYEFAAGLNACLDRVNELIATATADLVTKEDLATLQRLQEEFSAELATLRGRVDALEARTAELEANQFSTTTKLVGEAIFNVGQVFGDTRVGGADLESNTTFDDRVRLNLLSSFTGKDQLQIRLQAGNIINNSTVTGTNMTRLGYDVSNTTNSVEIDKINYAFNFSDAIRVKIDANNAELYENVNVFNPDFRSSGTGAISRYGRFSPIYRQGSGGAGLTVTFNPQGTFSLTGAYLAPKASAPNEGFGVFDGDYAAFGQLEFKPSKALNIGLTYAHSYDGGRTSPTGVASNEINFTGSTGSAFAIRPFGNGIATTGNHYGVQATFQPSSKFTIGGWFGYSTAIAESGVNRGSNADVVYWAASLGIKDLGREGNVLGLLFGQQPRVTENDIAAREDDDTSYHLEALYKVKVSSNIQVTPGLLVIFNPEHNDNNDTIYVGTLRTTFTF